MMHIARAFLRTFAFVLVAGMMVTGSVVAQSSEAFRLTEFDGGRLTGDVRFGSNLFGSGMGAGSFGRVQSALGRVDGASVFGNPAHLTFVRRPQIGIEFRFPLSNGAWGVGPTSFVSRSEVQERTDRFLTDMQLPEDATPVYTRVSNLTAGQPRQLAAFWLNWPVSEHVSIGFGYLQPFSAIADTRLEGLSTRVTGRQYSPLGLARVDVWSELAGSVRGKVQLDELTIGTGGLLESYYFGSVWWGISFFRYDVGANMDLDAAGNGSVAVAGSDERYFNDAGDPATSDDAFSNRVFWRMRANYRGSGTGARIGFVHRTYGDRIGSSLLFNVPPHMTLSDPRAFAESYLPSFVVLAGTIDPDDPDNVELLDIDQLDLNQPTASRKSRDYLGTEVAVGMPVSITGGIDLRLGPHTLVLNGIKYWGAMSASGQYGRENGVIQPFKLGFDPSWSVRGGLDLARGLDGEFGLLWIPVRILTLDLDGLLFQMLGERAGYAEPRYRFSGGYTWGAAITEGTQDTVTSSLRNAIVGITPVSFSLGRTYRLRERTHVGVHVAGFPDLLMRFSVAFDVD